MSGKAWSSAAVVLLSLFHSPALASEIIVAPSGGDYASIQNALDAARAGDTVTVLTGAYREALTFPRSGSAAAGHITLRAGTGETVVVDPDADSNVICIQNKSYLKVIGLKLTNSRSVSVGVGIRIEGWADRIEIRNNEIYGLKGSDAMGIMVLGNSPTPVSRIIIAGNHIHDCEPAQSEALALNGNVTGFEVTDNTVHDVNNIGLDFIGGESWTGNYGVARNGICRGNHVYRARSGYGGGYAAGIYVDGGKDIVVERNSVRECDLGIEIGAENAGCVVTGVIVRNNIVYSNDKAGVVFGGYDPALGRVNGCEFVGNTLYKNDALQVGDGEFCVNWAEGNLIRNNVVWVGPANRLICARSGSINNAFDYNLYYGAAGAAAVEVVWQGTLYPGFADYRLNTGQDPRSLFADPRLEDPGNADFHLTQNSPAIGVGDTSSPSSLGEFDYYGDPRVRNGAVDIGADEFSGPCYPGGDSGDYDGDGTSDIAVFSPAAGMWSVRGMTRVYFGSSSDVPVPGDYNGDGTTDVGVFRPGSGLWGVRGLTRLYYGSASDIPVPGDYDGDGSCEIGIFRSSGGLWAVTGVTRAYFGGSGDTPVPGDYDGDGRKNIALFRDSSGLWAVRGLPRIYYGSPGDTVVPGDYNGDGTWEVGVFRSSSGMWGIRGVTRLYYGSGFDRPAPADYNGDSKDDAGIFRASSGFWAIRGITRAYYGSSGDIPLTR